MSANVITYTISKEEIDKLIPKKHCSDNLLNQNNQFYGYYKNNRLDNLKSYFKQKERNRKNICKDLETREFHSHSSKLTELDIKIIRNLHRDKVYTQKELSKIYNICTKQISAIVNKKSWKWVE